MILHAFDSEKFPSFYRLSLYDLRKSALAFLAYQPVIYKSFNIQKSVCISKIWWKLNFLYIRFLLFIFILTPNKFLIKFY